MLTVVTPATETRLTTVAHVRADLGLKPGAPSDEQLSRYIDQASAAIVDYCRRPFALIGFREQFGFGGACRAPLLSRSPVTEISAVRFGAETVAPDGYQLDPETNRLERVADGFAVPWGYGTLVVTYSAGYVLPAATAGVTLPQSVERAAVRLVGAYLSAAGRDSLVKTETTEGVGSTSWWVPGAGSVLADPEAEQLLAPFRRLF